MNEIAPEYIILIGLFLVTMGLSEIAGAIKRLAKAIEDKDQ